MPADQHGFYVTIKTNAALPNFDKRPSNNYHLLCMSITELCETFVTSTIGIPHTRSQKSKFVISINIAQQHCINSLE